MQRGFTLLEVMVAAVILSIGCLGVLGMLLTAINNNRLAHDRTVAITLAEQELGELEALASKWTGVQSSGSSNLIEKLASYVPVTGTASSAWYFVTMDNNVRSLSTSTATALNVNGIRNNCTTSGCEHADAPPGRFYIGFKMLPGKNYSRNSYVRGAVRVSWNRSGAFVSGDNCNQFSSFDAIGSSGLNANCAYVTLPFAFKKGS